MTEKTFRIRTKFLVNKEYQFQFVQIVLVQTLLTSLLLIGIFYFFQRSQVKFLVGLSLDKSHYAIIQNWSGQMFIKILAVVALACAVQCFMAIFFSHKAAGPMHRLKRYLQEISGGAAPQSIQFRRHDHFKDVQGAYNEMVVVLEKERQNDLRIVQQMEDGIAHLKRLAKDEQVYQMADYLERLNNDLKNFKTR